MRVTNHDQYVIYRAWGTVLTYQLSVACSEFKVAQIVADLNLTRTECPDFNYVLAEDWKWGMSSENSTDEQAKIDWIDKHIK